MRKNQGITLVALIITIIIMLILVAVSVNVLIKSNLIGTAEKAGDKYKTATEEETKGGTIEINGKKYNSIDDYMKEINPIIVEPENIDDWIYAVEDDGTITLNGYKGQDKEVVIPNYINGVPVKKLGYVVHGYGNGNPLGNFWDPSICKGGTISWYWKIQNDITSVVISEGIEMIDKDVFFASQALTNVTIPSSVTSIGSNAFGNCTSLTKITIPSSVTSIESGAFDNCTSLTEITIPSSVTSIGSSAFSYCTSLTKITIPSSVTSIGSNAFGNCTSLTKITIPSSVTSIESGAFDNCTSLTEITIPSSVTSIGYSAFSNCTSLTEITIPSSVTAIGRGAFSNCTSLTEITIPSSVTTMAGYVFGYIPLITVHVPWKEGEKPDGWDENWAKTRSDYTITIDYAK